MIKVISKSLILVFLSSLVVGCGGAGTAESPNSVIDNRDKVTNDKENIIEDPVILLPDTSITNEPIINEPITEEPIINEPITEEPVIEEPVINEPVTEEPIINEPINSVISYDLGTTLKVLGNITSVYYVGQNYFEEGYEAFNSDKQPIKAIIDTSNLNMNKVGTYKVKYSVTTNEGLVLVKYRTVLVKSELIINNPIAIDISNMGDFNSYLLGNGEQEAIIYRDGIYMDSIVYNYDVVSDNLTVVTTNKSTLKFEYNGTSILAKQNDLVISNDSVYGIQASSTLNLYSSIEINNQNYENVLKVSFNNSTYYYQKNRGLLFIDKGLS
jgi:hypothetical protein